MLCLGFEPTAAGWYDVPWRPPQENLFVKLNFPSTKRGRQNMKSTWIKNAFLTAVYLTRYKPWGMKIKNKFTDSVLPSSARIRYVGCSMDNLSLEKYILY